MADESVQKIVNDANEFFKELGMENLDDEKKAEFIATMNEVIMKKLLLVIMERLDDEGKKQLEEKIDAEISPEEMEKFLVERIPDYNEMAMKISQEFRDEMKRDMAKDVE